MVADIAYAHKDYTTALNSYTALTEITNNPSTKLHAQVQLLRSAQNLDRQDVIITQSQIALDNNTLNPETAIEIRYYRAKAYLAKKKHESAIEDLKILSADTRNVYGAEARYLLAELYYNTNRLDQAEREVLDYINVSTPHSYWLARSFVLLSDVYVKKDQKIEAKQYLLSLKQSYHANDDIAAMIAQRLQALEVQN